MPTIAICDELKEKRAPLVVNGPLACEADSLCCSDDVHAVDLEARDLVTTSEVGGVGGAAFRRSAHTVLVVLADKDGWKIPQFSLKEARVRHFTQEGKEDGPC
jgi:hypothetical protein